MHKRSSTNANIIATRALEEAVHESKSLAKQRKKKNPAAVSLGRLGGLKGGLARAQVLTGEERSDIARRAAQARWLKERG